MRAASDPRRGPNRSSFSKPVEQRRREVVLGLACVALLGGTGVAIVVTSGGDDAGSVGTSADALADAPTEVLDDINGAIDLQATADEAAAANEPFVEMVDVELAGLVDPDPDTATDERARADGGCTIGALSLRLGADGDGVVCLQDALADEGYLSGASTGEFGQTTFDAVMKYQQAEDMYVDGVVGRETALGLEIWPDEESLVTRTPLTRCTAAARCPRPGTARPIFRT